MAVTDKKMDVNANTAREQIDFSIITAVSQAGVLFGANTPGYRFQVVKVAAFAVTVTATITVDVQIGGVSVLTGPITPVAGTEVAGTLTSTLANLRPSGTNNQLQVKLTTNGSGAATNLTVFVWIRPYPLNQDAAV